ncbi:hypothetical protein D6827_03675, partial [Candidatus Parcubacteria bacterium]
STANKITHTNINPDNNGNNDQEQNVATTDYQKNILEKFNKITLSTSDGDIEKYSGFIKNSSTGDDQHVRIYIPSEHNNEKMPVVFLIPGGTGDGSEFEEKQTDNSSKATKLTNKGFITVVYSPLGTGESEGKLNYQGYNDQDGLAQIIKIISSLSIVDNDNMGLASFSYGATAAAGILARYPELNIKFWSDWEGPSSRYFTTVGCKEKNKQIKKDTPGAHSCNNDNFWQEREAAEFIKTAKVDYYWRVQQEKDHVQPTYGHTIEMINNAVANKNIPWVKLNNGEVNATYTEETVIALPNTNFFDDYIIPHLEQMSQF